VENLRCLWALPPRSVSPTASRRQRSPRAAADQHPNVADICAMNVASWRECSTASPLWRLFGVWKRQLLTWRGGRSRGMSGWMQVASAAILPRIQRSTSITLGCSPTVKREDSMFWPLPYMKARSRALVLMALKQLHSFFFLKASHFKLNLCVDKSYNSKSLKHLFFCISTIPPSTSFTP